MKTTFYVKPVAIGLMVMITLAPVTMFARSEVRATKAELAAAKSEAARERVEAKRQARLADAKLRACEQREKNIKTRSDNFVRFAEGHLATFDKIADKIQAFAVDKNRKPADYDALVAEVETQHEAVVTAIADFKADAASFECDGDNPKGIGRTMVSQAKVVREALKTYKDSIRALLLGVKQTKAAETSEGGEQ